MNVSDLAPYLAKLTREAISNKVYQRDDWPVPVKELEGDGRKRPGVLRALVTLGYLTEAATDKDKMFILTDRAYRELEARPVEWVAESVTQQSGRTRPLPLPFLLWDRLAPTYQKTLLETPGEGDWYLLHRHVVDHGHPARERDVVGPFPLDDLHGVRERAEQAKEKLDGERWPHFHLCVTSVALMEHCEAVNATREFEALRSRNLKWGLVALSILGKDDAAHFGSNREQTLTEDGWGNLGDEPSRWGERLAEQERWLAERIEQDRARLTRLQSLAEGVKAFGGWDKFLTEYEDKLRQSVAKKAQAAAT